MTAHNSATHAGGTHAYEATGGFTGWVDDLTSRLGAPGDADGADPISLGLLGACAAMTVLLAVLVVRTVRANRARPQRMARSGWSGERGLIGVAIAVAVGVAGIGGVRSFEAVSDRFDSALVPLTADGMIIACTALRLAAVSRGWRLPGSLVITYAFITGTVWLNVASAHGWADAVAHALAPLAYAALVEMLAHMLRLHLGLVEPPERRRTGTAGVAGLARLGWLTWITSPVVTTRVGLHLARTGSDDPVAARALVQQLIRMGSRLEAVCPSRPGLAWLPFGRARAARTAALQTVRDGLLSARDLARLLPAANSQTDRVTPGGLLALVDSAALQCTAPTDTEHTTGRTGHRTVARTADRTGAGDPVHHEDRTSAATTERTSAPQGSRTAAPRTDDDLVAELHRHAAEHNDGQPMSQREVMRVLGVGTPKAKRLAVRAGWAEPTAMTATGADRDAPEQIPGQLALVHKPDQGAETDEADETGEIEEAESEELSARNSR